MMLTHGELLLLSVILVTHLCESNTRRQAMGVGKRTVSMAEKKQSNSPACSSKNRQDTIVCGGLGSPGPPGNAGQPGIQGIQGVQGVQGPVGLSGGPGINGAKGDKGDDGLRGFKGRKGDAAYPQYNHETHVAFSVTMDTDMEQIDYEYRVVKYNVVLTNTNNVYSTNTGAFTAPVNGTYMVGFSGVSYHGQNVLLHLIRSGKRVLSAFDNSGCACCEEGNMKCAGSASNAGVFTLEIGDKLWIELPDQHGLHNAPYHNYASFYGYMLYPLFGVH